MNEQYQYVKVLESFKKRKGMYVSPENLESVSNFLSGFICAAISQHPELNYPHELIQKVGAKRGWKKSACGPIYNIRGSSLSEIEKMDELISIHIECFEIIFDDSGQVNA
jgi:hypothetical protein